jgi:hypothetical protein
MKDYTCETCLHRERDDDVCDDCEPQDPLRCNYQSVRGTFGSGYKDTAVQCPFYRWAKTRHRLISCEGPENDTVLTLFFTRKSLQEDYLQFICEGAYTKCRIYQMLTKKYETEG